MKQEFVKIVISDESGLELQHYFVRVGEWGVPAGRIEKGETPAQAARRELLERTGYDILENALSYIGEEDGFYIFYGKKKDLTPTAKPGEKGGYTTKIRWE